MSRKNDTRMLLVSFILIAAVATLVTLALFTVGGKAQVDEGYPAPIDEGYPIGYPVDAGYPIYDPYPVGYPIDYSYPEPIGYQTSYPEIPDTSTEPTFKQELQAEMVEIQEVIDNVQPVEQSRIYQTWQQLKVIIKHYYGKMIVRMR